MRRWRSATLASAPWSTALPGVGMPDGGAVLRQPNVSQQVDDRAEPGFGPHWWRSGTRTWLWWVALVFTVSVNTLDAANEPRYGTPPGAEVLWVAGAIAEIAVAFLFWMWRPRNIVGPLLVAYINLLLIEDLWRFFPGSRLAVTVFDLFFFAWTAVYVWMLLTFPSGKLWNRPAFWLTVWMSALYLSVGIPTALWGVEDNLLLSSPPTFLYLGHGWSTLDVWPRVWSVAVICSWVVLSGFLIVRIARAAPGARRRLIPLFSVVIVLGLFDYSMYGFYTLTEQVPSTWWNVYIGNSSVVMLFSAFGAAFGLARVRKARGSVADLVVELGRVEPGRVHETLARTLGDPTLILGLWLPERGIWVDEGGRELRIPSGDERGVTYVGEGLAVLIHDRDLLDQPRLLEAVGSAGRLALANERLQAEQRAQLAELRDSRARIVRAGDEERRRLERDLHDGAQQRLLGVGLALQLLRSTIEGNRAAAHVLDEAEAEVQGALRELRELARGIHPAVLTDQGLAAAVRTLGERSPIPVRVETSVERLPGHVETAAYFVVAEALANVVKYAHASHAWVIVERDHNCARVEVGDDGVGGAVAGNGGSGLRGLADRVGALDGRIELDSPVGGGTRLTAVIPCAS
jgi:signal transduction histidine kinase